MGSDEVYRPGDMVTVSYGMFKGMPGAVVGPDEAKVLYRQLMREELTLACPPGVVWVALNIYGRVLVIQFEPAQLERREV